MVEVGLTRRTARFGELASAIEEASARRGVIVTGPLVDEMLRERVELVARLLGVGPRTALWHAPDDVVQTVTADIIGVLPARVRGSRDESSVVQ